MSGGFADVFGHGAPVLEVLAVDGKKIKNAARRLKTARSYAGTPLGGKAIVDLNLRTRLVVAVNAHLDGETNDAPLVPDLLPEICQRTRKRLWIADRQFCDLTQPYNFLEEDDHFLHLLPVRLFDCLR